MFSLFLSTLTEGPIFPSTTTKKPGVSTTTVKPVTSAAPASTTTRKPNTTLVPSTKTASPTPGPDFCSDKPDGTYAHPTDKTSFYLCAGGKTYPRKCGVGTVFDDSCKCCVWP